MGHGRWVELREEWWSSRQPWDDDDLASSNEGFPILPICMFSVTKCPYTNSTNHRPPK